MDVEMDVRVSDDPAAAAAAAIAEWLHDGVRERGEAFLAVSGGDTAPPMFAALVAVELPWERIGVWQVDERIAPDGHEARNARQLAAIPGRTHLMPVTVSPLDLDTAAEQYAASLPPQFDVVHLGLGDDGHTASWAPGVDEVVETDALVAVTTDEFNGFRRMTLTPHVVNAATRRAMLTVGGAKAGVVARWFDSDPEIAASRLERVRTVVFLDPPAAAGIADAE